MLGSPKLHHLSTPCKTSSRTRKGHESIWIEQQRYNKRRLKIHEGTPRRSRGDPLDSRALHQQCIFFPLWERVAANQFPAYLKVTVERSNKKGQKLA